jgi:hypothetical protein
MVKFESAMGIDYPGGFAIRCITTLPTVHKTFSKSLKTDPLLP